MTVYVDDMRMKARVGSISGKWSHLIADTREELHEFAAQLGLKRSWFQEHKDAKPGSYYAESWHYDVTDSMRLRAIQLGAVAIGFLDIPDIIHARMERHPHMKPNEMPWGWQPENTGPEIVGGRYKSIGPDGKEHRYTRVSTFAHTGEDRYGLDHWEKRVALSGLASRPDLIGRANATDVADSKPWTEIIDQASEAGGRHVAANEGTALHGFVAGLITGSLVWDQIPPNYVDDVRAYFAELERCRLRQVPELIEFTVLNDVFELMGTADGALMDENGCLVIGDAKSGQDVDRAEAKVAFAVQLAMYANAKWLRLSNGTLVPAPAFRTDYGVVIHVPRGSGQAHAYRVNLDAGLAIAGMIAQLRSARKFKDIMVPFVPGMNAPLPGHAAEWNVNLSGFAAAPAPTPAAPLAEPPLWSNVPSSVPMVVADHPVVTSQPPVHFDLPNASFASTVFDALARNGVPGCSASGVRVSVPAEYAEQARSILAQLTTEQGPADVSQIPAAPPVTPNWQNQPAPPVEPGAPIPPNDAHTATDAIATGAPVIPPMPAGSVVFTPSFDNGGDLHPGIVPVGPDGVVAAAVHTLADGTKAVFAVDPSDVLLDKPGGVRVDEAGTPHDADDPAQELFDLHPSKGRKEALQQLALKVIGPDTKVNKTAINLARMIVTNVNWPAHQNAVLGELIKAAGERKRGRSAPIVPPPVDDVVEQPTAAEVEAAFGSGTTLAPAMEAVPQHTVSSFLPAGPIPGDVPEPLSAQAEQTKRNVALIEQGTNPRTGKPFTSQGSVEVTGQTEVTAEELPGTPSNVSVQPDGSVWERNPATGGWGQTQAADNPAPAPAEAPAVEHTTEFFHVAFDASATLDQTHSLALTAVQAKVQFDPRVYYRAWMRTAPTVQSLYDAYNHAKQNNITLPKDIVDIGMERGKTLPKQ